MDVLAVADSARRAVDAVRSGAGPHFLEARTYRFRAHSMFDPERYRAKSEVAEWREKDPLLQLQTLLESAAELSEDNLAEIERSVAEEIDDAVAFAESEPNEDVSELDRFVYSDSSTVWRGARPWATAGSDKGARS